MKRSSQRIVNFRLLVLALCAAPWLAYGQQKPYFVTYDHHMEEPGSLEVSINPVIGKPRGGDAFIASWVEFEYGTKGWGQTELYLEGQRTEKPEQRPLGIWLRLRCKPSINPRRDRGRMQPLPGKLPCRR